MKLKMPENIYLRKTVFTVTIDNRMLPSTQEITRTREYCNSLTKYSRRKSWEVKIGDIPLGDNPIRIQSMTTVDTMDTRGTIDQSVRMIEAGCDYVRITAPSLNEAQNLEVIKKELRARGYQTPLIADIHFTPNAAELAARIVEKVRINPGNYADKKKFENIRYTRDTYQAELDRIREKFTPLVNICKEYGTAMRIGTNHGSLSDRIMSRYGDTPLGMVESALEFLRICEDLQYYAIVLSMKASNPQVMIQAYRLLVNRLSQEGLKPYPLHLGVTEAGGAEDGRIKSSVGIGALLEDGLGDTVRVSLTEEPEEEVPVAKILAGRYSGRENHDPIPEVRNVKFDPFSFSRRITREMVNIGGKNVPRVIADYSRSGVKVYTDLDAVGHNYDPVSGKFSMRDNGVDFIFSGNHPSLFLLPIGIRELINYKAWKPVSDRIQRFPVYSRDEYLQAEDVHPEANIIRLTLPEFDGNLASRIAKDETAILILDTNNSHGYAEQRRFYLELIEKEIICPVIIARGYEGIDRESLLIYASTDIGALLTDGFGDGVMLYERTANNGKTVHPDNLKFFNETAFGILQAARARITKTEYISCPSCGRTLFDLQIVTSAIRKRTDHLKGVKIAIMGCIVNGPGEMADADYGYVGSGKGKVSLYRGKQIVKRNIPSAQAMDELEGLIRDDGRWTAP